MMKNHVKRIGYETLFRLYLVDFSVLATVICELL